MGTDSLAWKPNVRRLAHADAEDFQRLRLEGFALHERQFRYAPEDEAHVTSADVAARLARDFVVGAYDGETLVGIAGLSRFTGSKVSHKALLWGMYLRANARGHGAADAIMAALLEEARESVEIVVLTVAADNPRATRLYERWGFRTYGTEPAAIKLPDGTYIDEVLMMVRLR